MIDRIDFLNKQTKIYFNESDEFYFCKHYLNLRKPILKLIFNAYCVEYDLVLKDYKIFFENKLKARFLIETKLSKESRARRKFRNKKLFYMQYLKNNKFYGNHFDLSEVELKNNVVFRYQVDMRKKRLKVDNISSKTLTKHFFYRKMIDYTIYNYKLNKSL